MKEAGFGIVVILLLLFGFCLLVGLLLYFNRTKPVDGTCSSNNDCNNGLVCDTTTFTCRGEIGKACSSDDQCITGTSCLSGVCANLDRPINNNPICGDVEVVFPEFDFNDVDVTCTPPYYKINGNFYCYGMIDESVAIDDCIICSSEDTVVDVVAHRDSVIFLLNSGFIIKESKDVTVKIGSSIVIESMISNNGRLYGLCKGKLYILDDKTYSTQTWTWYPVDWSHDCIDSISTTLDGQHIFIKVGNRGYIYNTRLVLVESTSMEGHDVRIYGLDLDHYIDWNAENWTGTVYNDGECYVMRDISGAVINHDGEIIAVDISGSVVYRDGKTIDVDGDSRDYDNVKYVNDNLYYIISKYKVSQRHR